MPISKQNGRSAKKALSENLTNAPEVVGAGIPQTAIPQTAIPQTAIPQAVIPQAVIPQAGISQIVIPQTGIPQAVTYQTSIPQISNASVPQGSAPFGYSQAGCRSLVAVATASNYVPPQLRYDSNGWYITYYAFNGVVGRLERKRIKLNMLRKRCRTKQEFMIQANDILRTIDNQLRVGATIAASQMLAAPVGVAMGQVNAVQTEVPTSVAGGTGTEVVTGRSMMLLKDVVEIYIKEQSEVLRPKSMNLYKTSSRALLEWVDKKVPGIRVGQFNKVLAIEYMEYIEKTRKITARSYNSFLVCGKVLFGWCERKCYCASNPFEGIQKKREDTKKRTIIKPEHQALIDSWFAEHYPKMQIVIRMVYTSLLRPVEISRVQVRDIDWEHHCFQMPGDKTKNHKPREARMDEELEEMLRKHIEGAKASDYLFSKDMQCGAEYHDDKPYRWCWYMMRKQLTYTENGEEKHFPDSYQLYSLKDTAINKMLKSGVDNLSVMQAAGHHDLKMTLIYADHHDDGLIDRLNAQVSKFGE